MLKIPPPENEFSSTFSEKEPLRIILEKPISQKVLDFLWTGAKILLLFVIISGFISGGENFPSDSGIEKEYFNGYFGAESKDATASEVAVISLFGEISDIPPNGFQGNAGVRADDLIFLLDEAASDPEIKAILLRIDSPGGTVLAAEKITNLVLEIKEEKPVYALLEGSATSGAYYIASTASKIYAYPSTLTGNIGVIVFLPKIQELLQKLGIEMRTITSGKLKDIGSLFRDLTPEERKIFDDLIKESFDAFVETVAKGRGMEQEQVRTLADGRIYSGIQAEANGLVDKTIGSFAEVLREIGTEISSPRVQAVSFEIPLSPWEKVLFQMKGFISPLETTSDFFEKSIFGNGPRFVAK